MVRHDEVVPILDFGAQYAQLIARRVREKGVYSELVRPDISIEELKKLNPRGLILSGGPSSVYEPNAPRCDPRLFDLGVPALGICYGMQLGAQVLGGQVKPAKAREYGRAKLTVAGDDPLVRGLGKQTSVWMSHGDQVHELPEEFVPLATTPTCPDAAEQFLAALRGVTDPQQKRKIIGREFVEAFRREAKSIAGAAYLAQGTLYPDVIESGHGYAGTAASIKLHHNVGGLPEQLGFELVEPLRELFKDEVRRVGEVLGLPEKIVWRHPFPGPGLAVRIMGEVTPERLRVLRDADEIVLEELVANNLYRKTAQVFAVLLPIGTVGVMGDARSYDSVIAIRAVETQDFMTADWARIPFDVLATMSNRIINEVRGVNRVVYDISSKPPATIEWE